MIVNAAFYSRLSGIDTPFLILLTGIAVVVGMIVVLRIHAFLALVAAALIVSLMAPGELAEKISRVAEAFGNTVGGIGIVIALAAVIGKCMMESGAADRIVRAFLKGFGEQRVAAALSGSGFLLSVPVFFDTVFYLLIPLARSLYRETQKHYVKYVMAISGGAVITHALVPPTPGPLLMAQQLDVDLGLMMLIGIVIGLPMAVVGLLFARFVDGRMPVEMRPLPGEDPEQVQESDSPGRPFPGLWLSLTPILLPVLLIGANTTLESLSKTVEGAGWQSAAEWSQLFGNANFALFLSALVALLIYVCQRRPSHAVFAETLESALMSGGVIILITAAGGAFGAMLSAAQIGPAIEGLFPGGEKGMGIELLFIAFGMAALLKFAQGSTTVAVITVSAMMAAMIVGLDLPYHPVYLATAIGGGGLVGSWMNDSGFWIFSKMSGLTETETLRTWTPLLALLGVTAFLLTLALAILLPLSSSGSGG